jgi:hypothetical protein
MTAPATRPAAAGMAVHCVGVSIPRTGHGFLRRSLSAYFRGRMAFCAHRPGDGCCGRIPCDAARGKAFWYQKNHDRELALDNTAAHPRLFYLVQDRHPLPQILSHLEQRQDHHARFTPAEHLWWLARQLVYRRRFTAKWIAPARPDILVLRYEALVADPPARIGALIERMTGSVDMDRLRAAVAEVSPFRADGTPFRPRDIRASRHFDARLHAAFEAIALAECTAPGYQPMLGQGGVAPDHALLRAYRTECARAP